MKFIGNKYKCGLRLPEKNGAGFTIIELIISIFVLSVAVIGVFSAFSIMTILTYDSADRLTATYLAQEGMEIIRNIRDTNWLNMDNPPEGITPTWDSGIDSCGQGCEVDYTTSGSFSSPVAPLNGIGRYLKIDASGFYSYLDCPSGKPCGPKFMRKIVIVHPKDSNGNEISYILKVIVEVAWNQKATILNPDYIPASASLEDNCVGTAHKNNCIVTEMMLYNWYNTYIPSDIATVTATEDSGYIVSSLDDEKKGTITNVGLNTGKDEFLGNLAKGQINQTWNISNITEPDVVSYDTLVATAQDGKTEATYTIILEGE